jgi:hypothetical protein
MKTLIVNLADYLKVNGWDLVQSHTQSLEWWAEEIWQMKSRWSPEGTQAFINFLVDPMWEGNRRNGQSVWAVGCSASFPCNRREAESGGILRLRSSKKEIEEFVEVVNGFRKIA